MATADVGSSSQHVQAKFFTKQLKYAVPDDTFFIPISVTVDDLNTLINARLSSGITDGEKEKVTFDFLVENEFLRVSVEEHLLSKGISTEAVIEIQYVKRDAAPELGETLVHDDWVSAVRAHNNLILTGSYDGIARIWNSDGELLMDTTQYPGHAGQPIKSVAWLNDDDQIGAKYFVTGSHDETLLVWQWIQRKNKLTCTTVCRGHARSVDCIAVSPNQMQFCSGSWDTMLKMWSAETGKGETGKEEDADISMELDDQRPHKRKKSNSAKVPTQVPLMTLSGHSEGISSVAWMEETSICTASWDHSIRLWDLQQASSTSTIVGSKAFFSIAYSPLCKRLVAASADRHVRLYDTRSSGGAEVKSTFSSHTAWVSCVAWSPKSEYQFISGSYDHLLKLWDTRCPRAPLFDMAEHDDKILAADWSSEQFMLSGGADNQVKVFKTNSENLLGCEL